MGAFVGDRDSRLLRESQLSTRMVGVNDEACPCGSGEGYVACCGKLHRGEAQAATAEQLMRSRYSAYAVRDVDYLLRSWHPRSRPPRLALGPLPWTGLEIVGKTGGGLFDDSGTVAFRAHYLHGGQREVLSENSLFERHDGKWTYVAPIV